MAWKKDMQQLGHIVDRLEERDNILIQVDRGTVRVLREWVNAGYVVVATAALSYWKNPHNKNGHNNYETLLYIEQGYHFPELLRSIHQEDY